MDVVQQIEYQRRNRAGTELGSARMNTKEHFKKRGKD
jgi:hypothetical protein